MERYKKKQTQRQKKSIYYNFMRFGDSITVPVTKNSKKIKQELEKSETFADGKTTITM